MNKRVAVLSVILALSLFSTLSFIDSAKAGTQTFGYTTEGGYASISSNLENNIIGSKFTCLVDGVVQNIKAYIRVSTDYDGSAKAAMYFASNDTLVASSSEITLSYAGNVAEWQTFTFAGTHNVSAGTEYILVVWSEQTSSSYYLYYDAGSTNQGYNQTIAYTGTFPDPLVPSNNDREYSIYCTVEETTDYNYYFYGLYDENTGYLEDAGDRAVNVTAYWNDGTASETFEVNSSRYKSFDTSPQYFHFELGTVDREYWLSADEGDATTTTIYIFNDTISAYTLTFRDWTGALATYSWVSALRTVNGSEVIVDKRKIDEENKVVMGLQQNQRYVIQVEAIVGTTYAWGDLTMTSDTTVDLVVKGTEFPQETILTYRYVRAWANRTYNNATHDSIYVLYEDTQEATTSVNITIYYGNDTAAHSYLYSDTDSFTYDWSDAVNTTSYYCVVTVVHATYGTLVFRQSFLRRYDSSPFDLDFLGALPGGVEVSSLLPMGLLIVVTLSFSALTAGVGGIVVVVLASLFTSMGWVSFDVNLLVFTAILAVLYAVLKNYHRVTVR